MKIPIESLNLQLLNVGLAQHNGDWNWKEVFSPFTRIFCVLEGSARLHLPDGALDLHPGMLYMVPAYTLHDYECRGHFTHYYLHVYEGYKSETNVFDLYDFPSEAVAHATDHQLLERICHLLPEAKLPGSDPLTYDNQTTFTSYVKRYNEMPIHQRMQIRGSLLIIFSRFMERAVPKLWTGDERLVKVLAYINDNIYDTIDIDDLADLACVTKPYLIRIFRRGLSFSPLQFINRKKVERAQLMLITENMPVKEVAYTMGFSDESYFIRLFKKQTGRTPQEYRIMHNAL